MSTLWSVPCNDLSDVKPYMALTTVFTPPSYCPTYFTDDNAWAGADEGTSGAVVSYAKQNEDDPVWYSCVPKEYNTEQCQALTFSPGLCPHGWTTLEIRSEESTTTGQSSDRTSTSTTSTTSTPVGPTEQPGTGDKGRDGDTGLSGGAIAGIVVGVVAALVLGVMMGLLLQRRRQRPVEAPGAHEQPIFVQQGNAGGGFGAEQSPNGPVAPGMAYAVEGGTPVVSGHMQPKE
ncbi:hypothetical protein ACHAPT_011786 [Fusarium lateritium]